MMANVPTPLPDQCLDSLAASAWKDNGGALTVRSSIWETLGRAPDDVSALSGGVRSAYDCLRGAGYGSAVELLEAHAYLPLFRPFANPRAYEAARESIASGRDSGIVRILAAFGTARIRPARWYCIECAKGDLARSGCAYARRVHQVVGVDYCPIHEVPLFRPRAEKRAAPSEYGLLLSEAELGEPTDWTVVGEESGVEKAVKLRFGRFAAAALNGSLTPLGPQQRRALLAARLESMPRQPGEPRSLPHRLETIVESVAPRDWLAELGFDPDEGSATRWPASFIAGISFQEDPTVGLLCAAILFDGPDDYNHQAARFLDREPGYVKVGSGTFPSRGRSAVVLTLPLMRALMSRACEDVVRVSGLGKTVIKQLIETYPGLSERRERVRLRRGLAGYKRILVRYARDNAGNATRIGARRFDVTAYKWVLAHDPRFLEALLPRRCGRRPAKGVASTRLAKRSKRRGRDA